MRHLGHSSHLVQDKILNGTKLVQFFLLFNYSIHDSIHIKILFYHSHKCDAAFDCLDVVGLCFRRSALRS